MRRRRPRRAGQVDGCAQVHAADADAGLITDPGHDLHGVLAVERDRAVDDAAAEFVADRGCVGPAAVEVNADRRGDPHDLIGERLRFGGAGGEINFARDRAGHRGECFGIEAGRLDGGDRLGGCGVAVADDRGKAEHAGVRERGGVAPEQVVELSE